jgi:hypothetical protein
MPEPSEDTLTIAGYTSAVTLSRRGEEKPSRTQLMNWRLQHGELVPISRAPRLFYRTDDPNDFLPSTDYESGDIHEKSSEASTPPATSSISPINDFFGEETARDLRIHGRQSLGRSINPKYYKLESVKLFPNELSQITSIAHKDATKKNGGLDTQCTDLREAARVQHGVVHGSIFTFKAIPPLKVPNYHFDNSVIFLDNISTQGVVQDSDLDDDVET